MSSNDDKLLTTEEHLSNFVKEFAKKYISVERIGTSEDLLEFIELIISEKNKFMNGSIVRIDGGLKT